MPLKQRLYEDRHCLGRVLQQKICPNQKHFGGGFRGYDWQVIQIMIHIEIVIYSHHMTLTGLDFISQNA